ncbi:predicted protein [Nematostella vectensis]|uniref:Protein kinase domain-containing protein n=1 Tax=Nematostella vectensis TaxID=45351 RepID=A7SL08_NEMVE|nr:predicted protein [Nematostella vectensis]|eukprot:XP_001627711.1 predicted protein [Nematostella vectensis]
MGCGSSKKLLQESPSERVVTTTLLAEGSPSREAGTRSSGDKPYAKRKLSGQKTKGEKYKARFDIRVTKEYEIKALIGRGSFSRVVRVEHYQTKQPYAIKMMEIEQGKDEFQSELAVLRRVKHEFVVRLYEVFECRNRVYLVMELATGGVLLDRILSKGFFTERDATRVIYMVLEGVRYLHSLGITHRDLKPENLLYYHPGNDSKIMITDFGLSNLRKHPDDRTMETTCGTPGYMAPEVLLSKPYTNSVDIWSIGVITFNVLSGQMPFADDHRSRLYKKILRGKFSFSGEPWDDVTDMAKDFINKLIVYEPEMRLTAEQGIKHPWIASSAATSSLKNLHKSISQNLLKSRGNSAKSNRSQKSNRSIRIANIDGRLRIN